MWKRTSRSISLGIMKVYWYGFDRGFHDSTKSVKSAFIKNQKPYIVLKEFLYNKHNTGHYFQKNLKENMLLIWKFFQDNVCFLIFLINADLTDLVESWKPLSKPYQYTFIITPFWPKFCVIIKTILCDYKNNHTLFIFVKFGVIIFIITQNFFYNHTKFWPIKCDYEIIHTKYWQILCDYSWSAKSPEFIQKIASGVDNFIITLYWPKFCVIIKNFLCDYKNKHTKFQILANVVWLW